MLPLDLVTEIFSFLPAKSLRRFRCLSKLICCTVDGREFIELHLRRSLKVETNHHVIIQSLSRREITACSSTFMADLNSLKKPLGKIPPARSVGVETMFGCCNGIIALCRMTAITDVGWTPNIALWNPSTREYRMLPETLEIFRKYWTHCLGFGYDHSADDYKVVPWKIMPKEEETFVIYSLKTASWTKKPITKGFPWYGYFPNTFGVFYKSSFHWIISTSIYTSCRIASFNLESEEFQMMQLDCPHRCARKCIFVFQGSLCVNYSFFDERGMQKNEVWMMKEYGVPESFTKISSSDITFFGLDGFSWFTGSTLKESLNQRGYLSCDPENQRYEQADELDEGASKYFFAAICADTLVPLA